jgi:hypothetical protein
LPGLAARAPLSETLEALDALAPVWAYVAREAPECAGCVTEAVASVAAACERAYGDAPHPKEVIDCLGDAHRSEATQRVALHLAARFPFPRAAREPIRPPVGLHAFEGVPVGCPSALQALKRLRERRPALARSGDFAAAVLRQSRPGEMGLELPAPEVAPYEALGDLAIHVPGGVAPLFAPWERQMSKGPGPWELYHHRRHPTGYKRSLQRRAREIATPRSGRPCSA